jgi:hypothetical protein
MAGMLDRILRKRERAYWFVCHTCMMQTGHDAVKSVFYSQEAPVLILGRPWQRCPRCGTTNTKSFQDLKNEGADNVLFGLEQAVGKHPRDRFEVRKMEPVKSIVKETQGQ